jgi:hypothetical protein
MNNFKFTVFLLMTMIFFCHCTKERLVFLSDEKEILSFSLHEIETRSQRIGQTLYLISDEIIDVNATYTPSIEISEKANINPLDGVLQVFSDEGVRYVVRAQSGNSKEYFVKLVNANSLPSDEKEIFAFSFPNVISNVVIDGFNIDVEIYDDVDIANLTPYIKYSLGATISPIAGEPVNFSNPVTYTVTAQDGSTNEYTVTVISGTNTDKEILSFTIPNKTARVTIGEQDILIEVYTFVDVSDLTPILSISQLATVSPKSGESMDFTNPVVYTVMAQNGSTKDYTVIVNKDLSRRNEIISFELIGTQQIYEREGDNLFIYVPYETDITNIQTNITISNLASISPASGLAMDFSSPQTYTVTASDGSSHQYTVEVKRSPWRNVIRNGEAPFAPRDQHELLVFQDKLWMLGGWIGGNTHANEVWNTEDGITWNLVNGNANWGTRHVTKFIVFKDRMWAIGGLQVPHSDIGIYSSVDGITWVKHLDSVPWANRYEPMLAEFNGKLWIMGGIKNDTYVPVGFNDIWSSEDGINWIREAKYATWQERGAIHGRVILNNELYMIGGGIVGPISLGEYLLTSFNDVWRTNDGINWQRILRIAPWRPRLYHSITEYNGTIYIVAGNIERFSPLTNEVWKSTDGINWEQVKHSFWSPRHATSVVGFKGKLWMTCGFFVNDVWVMDLE